MFDYRKYAIIEPLGGEASKRSVGNRLVLERLTPPSGEQATDKLDGVPRGRLRIYHKAVAFIGSEDNSHPKSTQTTVIEMYYLGIDVGKKHHVASILGEGLKKPLFKGFSFANTTEGAESLVARISEITPDAGEVCVGMEATGHYWLALYSFLFDKGYTIHVINPIQTDGWRKGIEIRKRKTDDIDSVLIADLMEDLDLDSVKVIADKCYESAADIRDCLMNSIVPDVGFIQDREERVFPLDYVEQDITPEIKASTKPEDIQACLHAGVLPEYYEGTNIRIEVQSLSNISCSVRHEDGKVTCPMGRELFKQRDTKYGTEYSSKEACRTCPNRCTDSKREKHVNIGRNSTYVPVIMYGDSRYPLQQIPDIDQPDHYNNFGKLKRDDRRVMIFIKRDIPKQKLRQQTSEHPFGSIKHYDDGRYFLCKGKEKVTAEFALSALAYNIRRAINICGGVHNLIDLYRRKAMPKIRKIAEF